MTPERDRDGWLSLFAENAVLEDPVGISPLDDAGKGHAGKAAIAAFYDRYIGSGRVSFDSPRSFACGDECAFVGSVYNQLPGEEAESRSDGVFVYRVDASGKLVSLRAFWEWKRPVVERAIHPPVGRWRLEEPGRREAARASDRPDHGERIASQERPSSRHPDGKVRVSTHTRRRR